MTNAAEEVVSTIKELKDWFKSGDKETEETEETDAEEESTEEETKKPVETIIHEDGTVEVDYNTYCKLINLASKQFAAEKKAAETEEVAE